MFEKIKQKWNIKIKEMHYLSAIRAYGKAYIKFLESVNEIQSFGEMSCFDGWPEIKPNCQHFNSDSKCKHTTCLMCPLNNVYVDANKDTQSTRHAMFLAQTDLCNAKVK